MSSLLNDSPAVSPATLPREELRDVIDLALWAGQLLLQWGAQSARVEETVHRLGTGLGCDWLDVFVSPSALVVTTTSGHEFRTKTRRVVRFGGVNMSVMAAVTDLSYRLSAGELTRADVRRELERIDKMPRFYDRWLTTAIVGLACAAFSQLFGGDWVVFGVTFVASAVGFLVRYTLTLRHFNQLLVVLATAAVAGSLASLGVRLGLGNQPTIALAASVLLLVPGVPLINSIEDLLEGHMVTGMARGVTGALVSLSIASGLAIAMNMWGVRDPWPTFSAPPSVGLDALWAAIAALGFALLFNVPPRLLAYCAAVGAMGHAVRFVLIHSGWAAVSNLPIASFIAAATVGLAGAYLAPRHRVPSSIFTISGVIPMVPGTFAFGTMIGVLQLGGVLLPATSGSLTNLLSETATNGIKTGLLLAALALGIALPTLLFRRIRPVV